MVMVHAVAWLVQDVGIAAVPVDTVLHAHFECPVVAVPLEVNADMSRSSPVSLAEKQDKKGLILSKSG